MKLRYLVIVIALLSACALSNAQSAYFCDGQGTKLNYERQYAGSGELKWKHTMSIDEVLVSPEGAKKIRYRSHFTKPSGAEMYGGPVALNAEISAAGDVTLDLAASLKSVFVNYLSENMVSADNFYSTLPANMEVGDKLPDAVFVVSIKLAKYRVVINNREVVRREKIKTPAGEFDCVVVCEHKIEKGPGRNRETTAYTWYAAGIGMVRHDTYDKKMNLETIEQLCSINR